MLSKQIAQEELFKLKAQLQEQVYLAERLLEISQKKTEAIIHRQMVDIDGLTQNELDMIKSFAEIEKKRQDTVTSIACAYNLKAEVTLLEIIKNLNIEDQSELLPKREKLLNLLKELKTKNEFNESLIQQSLAYVDFFVNLVSEKQGVSENTYNGQGHATENAPTKRMMDLKL